MEQTPVSTLQNWRSFKDAHPMQIAFIVYAGDGVALHFSRAK